MAQNNPLLVLGPYGSLCWRGVISGWSIGQIRLEALRVFGQDEVLPFLKRLVSLGFLTNVAGLDHIRVPREKIKKEFHAPEIQSRLALAAVPWYCLWEICTACDLRCKTCYLPHFCSAGPSTANALRVAQQIIDAGIFYACIMGGEPLLRRDLERIVQRMRAAGLFVKVISNGQKLTHHRAKALVEADLNEIEISFDGLCQRTHDFSRGQGTYVQARRAVRNAQKAGIPRVAMVWTLHSSNVRELDMLPQFMRGLAIHECYLSLFRKTGQLAAQGPFYPVDVASIEAIRERLVTWNAAFPELTIVLPSKCSCGRTSMVIGYNGDVRVCSFLYEAIGNIDRDRLVDIWRSLARRCLEPGPLGYCCANGIPLGGFKTGSSRASLE
jgi:MoaA/NifB/PqqE/SkfB family radical SAM enzyme